MLDPLEALVRGEVQAVCLDPDGCLRREGAPAALLPGSFNPLHAGHLGLAGAAERLLNRPVAFELTVCNADKPPLSGVELRRRAAQFAGRASLWLTRAGTFVEKARLFGSAAFVVGADTARRIVDPRFYGGSAGHLGEALRELRQRGNRFLVAGRSAEGAFVGLEDLEIPAEFRDLFEGIPEEVFRLDISSTALRQQER